MILFSSGDFLSRKGNNIFVWFMTLNLHILMEIADLLSTAILFVTGALVLFKLGRFLYNLFYGDFVLTNPKTGKSVTLGRHHRDGLSQEIQDVLD